MSPTSLRAARTYNDGGHMERERVCVCVCVVFTCFCGKYERGEKWNGKTTVGAKDPWEQRSIVHHR